jgi:hypothetical protein
MPEQTKPLSDLFYAASRALGCDVLIETPWIAAEWVLAHHRDAMDAEDRDMLRDWAAQRRKALH